MPLQYVNRRGQRYFVHQGTTKTGKPRYYCSKKPDGPTIERLPDEFELYENLQNAVVTVRKLRPTVVAAIERQSLVRWAKQLAATQVIVDVEANCLIVYASDVDAESALDALTRLLGSPPGGRKAEIDWITSRAHYSPTLRFKLEDEDNRRFSAQRWCYLGGIDDWIPLNGAAHDLESLARQFLPHVGRENFFELM
ncbi:MAG: hypothetical protein IT424_14920 [Pirellulales bacterium]|nr:hypothetical protein [Pirellulales bacterium]